MPASLLLASNSPRRRELLLEAGFSFETRGPQVEERFGVNLTLRELTALNAIRKAMLTARLRPKDIVLAADTLVSIDDRILGKPKDGGEAIVMLERLSGRAHDVGTSVFICHLEQAKSATRMEPERAERKPATPERGRGKGAARSTKQKP